MERTYFQAIGGYDERYREGFHLECLALQRVRELEHQIEQQRHQQAPTPPARPEEFAELAAELEAVAPAEARAAYHRVLELDPENPHAFNTRANSRMAKEDRDGALADYDAALALYRGPLMEEDYDDWIEAPRTHYEGLYLAALAEAARLWEPSPVLEQDHLGVVPRLQLSLKVSALSPHLDPIDPDGSFESVARRLRPLIDSAMRIPASLIFDMEQAVGEKRGAQVGLIEDVSTTGTQVLAAARALEEAGCQIGIVLLAIDRGGGVRLREAGYRVKAVVDVGAGDGAGPADDERGD